MRVFRALRHSLEDPTIARRRYFRPEQNFRRGPRLNEQIRKSPVRLIDENDNQVGVVDTAEALQRARDAGMDLIEIAADSDPPVCKIVEFGKWRYEQSKRERANKQKSKMAEIKEVRLGRSMKIDPHDIEIRLNQARRFLMDGHKVQIVQNFRGREMMHQSKGLERMKGIVEKMSDIAKLEAPPRQAGRRMSMLLTPDKAKIEQIRKQQAAEAGSEAAPESAPEPATEPVTNDAPQAAEE